MNRKPYRLLVVAHPDDETIFFGGLLQQKRDLPWLVVCVTDGNADGRGQERKQEFLAATKLLGVKKTEHWDFLDKFPDRLPVDKITERLRAFPAPKEVYTHGPMGEYGHPHHQDVCLATHRAFPKKKIFSPAWNAPTDLTIKLSAAQWKKKTKAFSEIYRKETESFLNILPNGSQETFCHFSLKEVEAFVGYLRGERPCPTSRELKAFSWLTPLLPDLKERLSVRLF